MVPRTSRPPAAAPTGACTRTVGALRLNSSVLMTDGKHPDKNQQLSCSEDQYLEDLLAEDLPGRLAAREDTESNETKREAKAAVYDAKSAQFKKASAKVITAKTVGKHLPASPQPRQSYTGRFGSYDHTTLNKKGGLLQGMRTKLKFAVGLQPASAAAPDKPDPWAGFVMPETLSSDEEDGDPKHSRSGEQLWHILRAKWKVFRASKGWLISMRTVHGNSVNSEGNIQLGGHAAEDLALARRLADQRCFFFVPDSPLRQKWDLAQMLMIMYVGTLIPYREAFDVLVEPGSTAFWLDLVVDLYFIVVREGLTGMRI